MQPMSIRVSVHEFHTILAALRFYQQHCLADQPGLMDFDVLEIATNAGQVEPLAAETIDQLCERLNFT